jgi:hypothetical protein
VQEKILRWDNYSHDLLAEQGIDREPLLAEIAEKRAGLIEHASAIRNRRIEELAKQHSRTLQSGDEQRVAWRLQSIGRQVADEYRDRLRFLDKMEDELHGGLLGKGAVERLRKINLAALLGQ